MRIGVSVGITVAPGGDVCAEFPAGPAVLVLVSASIGTAYTIDLASGAEPRRFADARDPVPVTAADRAAWLERNGAPDDLPPSFRASRQARLDAMPFPESMPFHGGLVLASDGAVWLEEWADEEGAAPVWTRFALDGGIDRIRFPDGFILHAVSAVPECLRNPGDLLWQTGGLALLPGWRESRAAWHPTSPPSSAPGSRAPRASPASGRAAPQRQR